MESNLDRKIVLKTDCKGSDDWCLCELGDNGRQIGLDQTPWSWTVMFSISEFRLTRGFGFGELSIFDRESEPVAEHSNKVDIEESEVMVAKMHPGVCRDGKWLDNATTYSMFGTGRTISEFTLRVFKAKKDESERCNIDGVVSYTTEDEFGKETSPDCIEVLLVLSESRFDRLATLIARKENDLATLALSRVAGLYSEWSPLVTANNIKVLVRENLQGMEKPEGCEIEPPTLRNVGQFELSLVTRAEFNIRQDFSTLDVGKVFEDESENEIVEDNASEQFYMSLIRQCQADISNLKIPLWILTFLVGAHFLSKWV